MYVKWTIAPSGFCIGVAEFNNKHYYCYGRNSNHLEKNIKTRLYQKEHISTTQVHLEHERSDEIDLQYADPKFITRFVRPKPNAQPVMIGKKIMAEPKPQVEYICEEHDGEMVVYEMKEVARYKVHKPKIVIKVKDEPITLPKTYGTILNTGEENGELQD